MKQDNTCINHFDGCCVKYVLYECDGKNRKCKRFKHKHLPVGDATYRRSKAINCSGYSNRARI